MRTSNILINLSGADWEFAFCDPAGLERPDDLATCEWLPATVPGCSHTDLMATGRLEDPFFRKQEEDSYWLEDQVFWYRTRFHYDPPNASGPLKLVFEGLDTLATVYLNGLELASFANMFIAHEADVTGLLKPDNELLVRFTPPKWALRDKPADRYWAFKPESKRQYLRKAQYSFGWDWGPRLATCGVWKDVYLAGFRNLRLTDICVRTRLLKGGAAQVTLFVEVEALTEGAHFAELALTATDEAGKLVWQQKTPFSAAGTSRLLETFRVEDPHLWWCAGQGDQPLYTLTCQLSVDGVQEDQTSTRFGIREVRFDETPDPDESGSSFILELNGRPIFSKGANWIPADSFLPRLGRAEYERLLRMALDANMNMLRIWGGGIYEQDAFYELCDELGILVWQDFMFACADYPGDDHEFVLAVDAEVQAVLRRLRNHPSIACWCGNNENDWAFYQNWCGDATFPHRAHILYHKLIPAHCSVLDPTRPYRPSSPWGGALDPNSQDSGSRHAYLPWGAAPDVKPGEPADWTATFEKVDIRGYRFEHGRFYGEYGIQSPPVLKTIEAWSAPEDLRLDSDVYLFHNKHDAGHSRTQMLVEGYFNPAGDDFERFVKQAQVMHMEGLKCAIEHFRSLKFHCAGSLFWQFEDCWPVTSWSILDYYRRPKPAFYAARRAYAPLLLTFQDVPELVLHAVNDAPEAVSGILTVQALTYEGELLAEVSQPLTVPANGRVVPGLALPTDAITEPTCQLLVAKLEADGKELARALYYFSELRDMALGEPEVTWSFAPGGEGEGVLTIAAPRLVRTVAIEGPDGLWLEDNYFDLLPGETRRLKVRGAPADLTAQLTVGEYVKQ